MNIGDIGNLNFLSFELNIPKLNKILYQTGYCEDWLEFEPDDFLGWTQFDHWM